MINQPSTGKERTHEFLYMITGATVGGNVVLGVTPYPLTTTYDCRGCLVPIERVRAVEVVDIVVSEHECDFNLRSDGPMGMIESTFSFTRPITEPIDVDGAMAGNVYIRVIMA